MITKTYLDGKLSQLEEKLRRKIEMKDEITLHKIEADIASLKEDLKLLEEKIEENKDIIRNYIEGKEIKPIENKDTVITSNF